jgi:hypothetical protein
MYSKVIGTVKDKRVGYTSRIRQEEKSIKSRIRDRATLRTVPVPYPMDSGSKILAHKDRTEARLELKFKIVPTNVKYLCVCKSVFQRNQAL